MKRLLSYVAVLLLLFTASVSAATVQLASSSTVSPPASDGWRACVADAAFEHRRFASCRVQVDRVYNGTKCRGYGSGTIINKRTLPNGKTIGLVITCAHLFPVGWTAEQVHKLSPKTRFPLAVKTNSARVLAIDWNNDISVWAIYVKKDQPVIPLANKYTDTVYNVCGFGPDAKFRSRRGKAMGYVSVGWDGGDGKVIPADANQTYVTSGQNQLYVQSGGVYVGDSGGGIITQDNKLAAVLWGGSNPNSFGTYSGTIKQFLQRRLPSSFQWGNNPCCPTGTPGSLGCSVPSGLSGRPTTPTSPTVTRPRNTPRYPTPDLDPLPPAPDIPVTPTPLPSDEDCEPITVALAKIQQGIDTLKARTDTSGDGLLPATRQGQEQMSEVLVQLQAQLNELASKDQSVTIQVRSPKFISPSYVDVSVLWALQQGSGIDHVVLIMDTSSDQWQQLNSEYELAREQFPAIVLFDVASRGIQFRELPQLVVYPVNPDKQPVIVKGVGPVVEKLRVIVHDAPGGFLGAK